jgi:hypothetical protein
MAYQTGVITSAADLVTVVRDFAVANGWSASGDILNKGASHVRLTAPSLSEVRIEGARGGNFSAPDQCPRHARIYNTNWPASAVYHLVAFDNPDTLWCTINFAVNRHQHLGFGTMEKYGVWEGGDWFHGHHTTSNIDANCFAVVDGKGRPYYSASPNNCALFWSQQDYSPWGTASNNKCSFLHCELRGEVWPATGATNDASDLNIIHCPSILSPIQKYNPNAFNGQTVLTPFQLFLQNTDGHYMSIGHLGHLRFVRLTNYNPGDVIELGADRWKLFPWHIKDANYPDGKAPAYSDGSFSSGLLGIAVRYDGP